MSNQGVDHGRRRFLTLTTTVVGGAGTVAAVWPFLASLKPSERAKALGAPVTVDVGKIEPGQRVIVAWRGKPVWFVRRTPEMLASLPKVAADLRDPESKEPQQPEYARNEARSIKPELLVMVGSCTHLGCSPTFRPDHPAPEIDANWQGGFYCPCHGSKFDLAGRVYKSVPAPLNLLVPPHRYKDDHTVVVGEDQTEAA
ncbi:ubiquinol-cytochrome c reductase iron-sulfur subunit [Fontimonas thermophila]|uniref:Ubiquinol-cytochrome c reductase iron-sulfur subunit n=1 Tax=Fontimonas thermophila TaxID=1076937 RepID=A0A1I2I7F2_9GAMM|nr:ubiquinol-cytochrome c reductase iron-sulfur subunit [Fontimonas thermophila]SFF38369.1 ubiquinol-cytochrome c reductase iron-sulfur subunit [Fontimonas thermophila]